jgi:hypothetical protein
MATPSWQDLQTVLNSGAVPAKPKHGLWTLAADYIPTLSRLRFKVPATVSAPGPPVAQVANGWTYAAGKTCMADGEPRAPINSANCLLASAPAGALIGKIGGSIAGKSDVSRIFVIGSYCVYEIDDKAPGGPLFLTMNADPIGMPDRAGQLIVEISTSNL